MKSKVMAVMMAAVMVMASTVVIGIGTSDAAGDVTSSKVILGESIDKAYKLYTDEKAHTASIEFNETAFSGNAEITFSIEGETVYSNKGGPYNEVTFSEAVKVTVVPVSGDAGNYSVSFNGIKTIGKTEIKIDLSVVDYRCSISHTHDGTTQGCVKLPKQMFEYYAYVEVIDNGATWSFLNNGTSLISANLSIGYEENINVHAKMSVTDNTVNTTFKYYAVNLPTGLSMKEDGKIGGKLAKSLESSLLDERKITSTIYAVSESGVVKSETFEWTIKSQAGEGVGVAILNEGEDTLTDVFTRGYITVESGSSFKITVKSATTPTGYSIKSCNVSGFKDGSVSGSLIDDSSVSGSDIKCYSGTVSTSDGSSVGTGTFELVFDIVMEKSGTKDTHIHKVVTVYVVGAIVDADLDPSVTSR